MRRFRWIGVAVGLALAACANPAAPSGLATRDCSDTRTPCDQVLTEPGDRGNLPYLAGPTTIVIDGGTVVRRH